MNRTQSVVLGLFAVVLCGAAGVAAAKLTQPDPAPPSRQIDEQAAERKLKRMRAKSVKNLLVKVPASRAPIPPAGDEQIASLRANRSVFYYLAANRKLPRGGVPERFSLAVTRTGPLSATELRSASRQMLGAKTQRRGGSLIVIDASRRNAMIATSASKGLVVQAASPKRLNAALDALTGEA